MLDLCKVNLLQRLLRYAVDVMFDMRRVNLLQPLLRYVVNVRLKK